MCSILGLFDLRSDAAALRTQALDLSRRMRHRGPDWSGVYADDGAILVHERLAIVGVDSGAQPLLSADGGQALAVNGEIYNHRALRAQTQAAYAYQTHSDCEVILALYRQAGGAAGADDFLNRLEGMFAFALWNAGARQWLIARDPIGIIPLYYGHDQHGTLYVASELKALAPVCVDAREFPPGHYWHSGAAEPIAYYRPDWRDHADVAHGSRDHAALRSAFEAAVKSHMMSDVPYGVLLSGGLDSSLVAAIAKKYAARRIDEDEQTEAWWPQLHSFAIGLIDSPDLKAAREVAAHLGTVHHEFHFTVQEGIDALSEVIYHLETYDVTTVRASTPMFLMARRIRAMGIKMVLSGEGSDELFGGYLYFHKAPDAAALHEETVRKLDALHLFDCLREQVDGRLGRGGPRALPRPPLHRRRDATRPRGQAVRQAARAHRKAVPARSLCRLPARQRAVAAEGAVLRRRRLPLDRLAEGPRAGAGQRPADGKRPLPLPAQHPADQGSLSLPRPVPSPLPAALGRAMRARRPLGGLLHRRRAGMGRLAEKRRRPQRPRRAGGTQRGVLIADWLGAEPLVPQGLAQPGLAQRRGNRTPANRLDH